MVGTMRREPRWRGGVSLDEKEGVIIVKPYRRKWTTARFNRTITQEDIDNPIEKALNNNNSRY
jgi:hypothetical protein